MGQIDELIRNVKQLRTDITTAAERAVAKTAKFVLKESQARTSHPFQEFPSYLHGPKGKYPRDAEPAFGRGTRLGTLNLAAGGAPAEELPVQFGPGENHPLNRDLTIEDVHVENGVVEAAVGYEDGVDPYIAKVLFGTEKMIPRPFLDEALEEAGRGDLDSVFANNLADELKKVID